MNTMPDDVYLAGIFDGEGSCCISRTILTKRRGAVYQVVLRVSMTDKTVPVLLHARFGGCLSESDRGVRRKHIYVWQAKSKVAVATLRALLPSLLVKRRQAEVCLDLQERILRRRSLGWYKALTPEERAMREQAYAVCRQLNRRGPV